MIEIRDADLDSDREVLIGGMLLHLTKRSDERRFAWLYRGNQPGPVKAWLATDTSVSVVIGSGAIVPQRVMVDGRPVPVAVMADFWIHPSYRSLGPALKLQRRCIEGAQVSHEGFYDLPQRQMTVIYKRLGIPSLATLIRLAKPLRADAHLQKALRSQTLARVAAPLANSAMAFGDRLLRGRSGVVISLHTDPFGPEFTDLAARVSGQFGACVARSADYLTWRYREHYFLRYEVFAARDGGRLVAYAVVTRSGGMGHVVDLFGEPDRAVITDLLMGAGAALRQQGVETLSIELTDSHLLMDDVRAAGFRKRQERPLIVHAFPQTALPGPDKLHWSLNYGDLDH